MQLTRENKVISKGLVTMNTLLLAMLSQAVYVSCHFVISVYFIGPPGCTGGEISPVVCYDVRQHAHEQCLCQQHQCHWHNYFWPGATPLHSSCRHG